MDTIAHSYTNNFFNQLAYEPQHVDIKEIEANAAELERKRQKAAALANITVTVDNMTFDADKESRDLMSQAIQVAGATGLTETMWKLTNNTVQLVTLPQLQQAIELGLQEHGLIVLGTAT